MDIALDPALVKFMVLAMRANDINTGYLVMIGLSRV
jgi:hypothetical protein